MVDAARLVLPVIGADLSPEMLRELGWLHWLRHCALPPGSVGADIQICVALFAPLAASFPAVVPPPVLSWLQANPDPGLTPEELGPFYATVITDAALTTVDPALTDLGIAACRAAADVGSEGDRPAHLFNLMNLSNQRYDLTFAEENLDDAVAAGRAALESTEHPIAAAVRFPLGLALLTRYGIRGQERDLIDSTTLLREAASSLPPGDPNRVIYLSQLAVALQTHCVLGGPLTVVEEYVEVTEVLADCAEDDSALGDALLQRGNALRVRFIRTGDAADIAESVRCARAALERLPSGHESHVTAQLNLASSLQVRFAHASAFNTSGGPDEADRAEATALARAADAAVPEGHPLRWEVDAALATLLRAKSADPATAVRSARATLPGLPPDSPYRGSALLSLGEALRRQYQETGDEDVLREAVDVLREAKTAGGGGPLGRAPILMALSMVLYETIKLAGADAEVDERDLDEAVETTRAAGRDIPGDTLVRGQQLWQLAELLQWRFQRTGQGTDLDERIEVLRAIVPLAPDGAMLTQCLSALADALNVRHDLNRDPADLDESIAALCRVVETLPAIDPELPDRQADAALALLQRFETRGEPADGETATRLIRSALDTTGIDDATRRRMLGILASGLHSTAIAEHDAVKLTEAIETCHAATPPDSVPDLFVTLTLSGALIDRYENTGAEADLETAGTTLRAALSHATGISRGFVVNNLILVLRHRFHRHGDLTDLTEAIDSGKAALQLFPPASPDALQLVANVASVQTDRYEWGGDLSDLTEAIDTLKSAVGRARADSPDLLACQQYLGNALRVRFQATAKPADLDESIAVLRVCLASATSRDQKVLGSLMLGSALSLRGQWSDDPAALAEASELLRATGDGLPVTHPSHGTARIVLAGTLRLRFVDSGEETLLTEAIEIIRGVISRNPDVQTNQASALIQLGVLLTLRFERTGDIGVLTESIEVLRRAVVAANTNNASAAVALAELANALRNRHNRLAEPADLDEAIAVAERAMALPGTTSTERSNHITALAGGLLTRSVHTGDLDDLNAAVDLGREAARTPAGHIAKAVNLMTLGLGLWLRFDRTGAVADLHAAIDALFEAAATAHPGHTMRPAMLTNLCNALRARAGLLGSLADLDAAVDAGRSAVAAAPAGHPAVPLCLMHLGAALHTRYLEKQDIADLDAAVAAVGEALDCSTTPSLNRTEILVNLAVLLQARRDRHPDSDDLDRAVALVREAITVTDVTHATFPMCVLNLSVLLRTRYDRDGDDADAAESIELARQAIDTFAAGDPRVALAWVTLGELHKRRHVESLGGPDLDAAAAAYRTAAESPSTAPILRTAAAGLWAQFAVQRRDWAAATEAFGVAVALLPQVAWHGVERGARERRLTRWNGLTRAAAAAALAAGDPTRAVELLEQGRAVLWAQALQTRDDLSMLRERDLALHDRLRALATMLAAAAAPDIPEVAATTDPWSNRSQHKQFDRIKLAEEWDRLLAEARALPGLEYLLRIPPLAALRDGLPDGPVVLLNVDRTRCDALIVHRDRDVEHVPLPDLSHVEVVRQADGYLRALKMLENSAGFAAASAKQTLHATLEWLWDTVADPVLTRLGYVGQDEPLPRLWWCPTGSLTLLPLHAAGYHDPADIPTGRTVLDRAVSSYTPTLRALTRANTGGTVPPADRRVLVVSMPETPPVPGIPGMSPLPGARTEAEFLSHALPLEHTLRVADAATHATVTADLRTHAYAHFACHGGQNLQQPSTGALYLRDKPLTVLDVAEQDLTHAELAYLSACSTAIGGTTLPDEAIHLAAALQLAGYRHVIATLWTITDRTAAEVTTTMYTGLLSPSGLRLNHTARLLHRTMRDLRDSAPHNPAIWASYIHSGP